MNNPSWSFSQTSVIVCCCPVLEIHSFDFPLHTPCISITQSPAASSSFPPEVLKKIWQPATCCSCAKFKWGLSFLGLDPHCNCLRFRTPQNWDSLESLLFAIFSIAHMTLIFCTALLPVTKLCFVHFSSISINLQEKTNSSLNFFQLSGTLLERISCADSLLLHCALLSHPFLYCVSFVCISILWPPSHTTLGSEVKVEKMSQTGEEGICQGRRNFSWIEDIQLKQFVSASWWASCLCAAEMRKIICS